MRWKCVTEFQPGHVQRNGDVCDIFPATQLLPELLLRTAMTAFHWEHRNPSSLQDTSISVQSLSFFLFPHFLPCCQSSSTYWGFRPWKRGGKHYIFEKHLAGVITQFCEMLVRYLETALMNVLAASKKFWERCSLIIQLFLPCYLYNLWQLHQIWANAFEPNWDHKANQKSYASIFLFSWCHSVVDLTWWEMHIFCSSLKFCKKVK